MVIRYRVIHTANPFMVGSHSGLVHSLGKTAYQKWYREFESRSHRHIREKEELVIIEPYAYTV